MKKTVKLILVVTVIAILSLMATSAYAYEIGDSVVWQLENWKGEMQDHEYIYSGELTEGLNNIEADYEDRVYKFEAKESGYYFVDGIYFEEKTEDNKIIGFTENTILRDEEDNWGFLYYLEKGTHYALHYFENPSTFTIEYYGTIKNVTFGENNEMIMNDRLFFTDDTKEILEIYNFEITVKFSTGKNLVNLPYGSNEYKLADEFRTGENEVIYKLPGGYEAKTTIIVYEIKDIVESVELSNIGRYTTIYKNYEGNSDYVDMSGETLTVKFTDGTEYVATVEDYNAALVVLPNGLEVYAYIRYNDDQLFVKIVEEEYMTTDCEVEGLMFGENLNVLRENNMESLRWSVYALKNAIEVLDSSLESSNCYFQWSVEEFIQVLRNIYSFVMYYTTISFR